MTVVSRISLKLVMLVIKQLRIDYMSTHNNKDPEWYIEHRLAIQCEQRISSYLPTGLFTIAILINSVRWLHLIRINRKAISWQREQLAQYLD